MQLPRRFCVAPLLAVCALLWACGVSAGRAAPAARQLRVPPLSQTAENSTSVAIDALNRETSRAEAQENSTQMVLATEGALHEQDLVLNVTLGELQAVEEKGLKLVDDKVTLEKEVQSERVEEASLDDDKRSLLKTVQEVMRTNQTKIEETQVKDLSRLERSVQERCAAEQQDLEARLQKAEARFEHAEAVRQKASVSAHALHDEQAEMTSTEAKLQAEIEELRQQAASADTDKGVAMESLRSLLRENAQYKQEADEKHSSHTGPEQIENVARPKIGRRAVAAAAGSDYTAIMGTGSAMDNYMAKVHSSFALKSGAPAPLPSPTPLAWRVDALPPKPAVQHKSGLASWLDGDAASATREAATQPPSISSPLNAWKDLFTPTQRLGDGNAGDDFDSDDGGPGSSSAAAALLGRAEESLSS